MSIKDKAIAEHAEEYVVLMEAGQTLDEAIQILDEKGYAENATYLVVSLPDGQYQTVLFPNLIPMMDELKQESLTKPLAELPIPLADRVIPRDTDESSGQVIDWVRAHPRSKVVIVDQNSFVALFANQDMGGDVITDSIRDAQIRNGGAGGGTNTGTWTRDGGTQTNSTTGRRG